MISYYYPGGYSEDTTPKITIGENFTIVNEVSLFDYIIKENWLQDEYDINDLIDFYYEKVKPDFEEENKDLTLVPKFQQNI